MNMLEESKKPLSDWLTCKKDLLSLGFTIDEIEQAIKISNITLRDLTDIQYVEHGKDSSYYDGSEYYELVNNDTSGFFTETIIVKGKQFERRYTAKASSYRTFAHYQGLKHVAVLRVLFSKRFAWFNKFKWDIYELRGVEHAEFYLKTPKGSLYVPLKAIMQSDFNIVKERMLSYYGWYRSGKDLKKENAQYVMNRLTKKDGSFETLKEYNNRQESYYKKEIAPLQTKEAAKLKAIWQ